MIFNKRPKKREVVEDIVSALADILLGNYYKTPYSEKPAVDYTEVKKEILTALTLYLDVDDALLADKPSDEFLTGLHLVVAEPRSGKTTFTADTTVFSIDEHESDYFQSEAIVNLLMNLVPQMIKNNQVTIDSLRVALFRLSGNLAKGGVPTTFRDVLTLLNALAKITDCELLVVFTVDYPQDFITALRGSAKMVTYISNFMLFSMELDSFTLNTVKYGRDIGQLKVCPPNLNERLSFKSLQLLKDFSEDITFAEPFMLSSTPLSLYDDYRKGKTFLIQRGESYEAVSSAGTELKKLIDDDPAISIAADGNEDVLKAVRAVLSKYFKPTVGEEK